LRKKSYTGYKSAIDLIKMPKTTYKKMMAEILKSKPKTVEEKQETIKKVVGGGKVDKVVKI
tara:strand:+ start:734 stop:916 length:183 start_codon:yes stop_codon:yes gene_type:complete